MCIANDHCMYGMWVWIFERVCVCVCVYIQVCVCMCVCVCVCVPLPGVLGAYYSGILRPDTQQVTGGDQILLQSVQLLREEHTHAHHINKQVGFNKQKLK